MPGFPCCCVKPPACCDGYVGEEYEPVLTLDAQMAGVNPCRYLIEGEVEYPLDEFCGAQLSPLFGNKFFLNETRIYPVFFALFLGRFGFYVEPTGTGPWTLKWVATDWCGNETEKEIVLQPCPEFPCCFPRPNPIAINFRVASGVPDFPCGLLGTHVDLVWVGPDEECLCNSSGGICRWQKVYTSGPLSGTTIRVEITSDSSDPALGSLGVTMTNATGTCIASKSGLNFGPYLLIDQPYRVYDCLGILEDHGTGIPGLTGSFWLCGCGFSGSPPPTYAVDVLL